MCGIYGIYNFKNANVDRNKLHTMSDTLKHRGPNSRGCFTAGSIGMGAVRLSILDLSENGNQPFFDTNRKFCIVYNGEIYNYVELRKELEATYNFSSNTDTEVALYSYLKWGESCLHKFNGMFAFAIFDIKNKRLFLARDRFGIKPLYYYIDDSQFIFSSELKVFKYVLKKLFIDEKVVYNYLLFNRTDYDNNTFFKGIKRLIHGHKISICDNNILVNKWYDLRNSLKNSYFSPEELKHDLTDSIRLRLRSDVSIGTCFSGGLDSSSIVSILVNELKVENIQTFSAVYGRGVKNDESRYIDEYKDILRENMHRVYVTSKDILADIDKFTYYIDEPVPQVSPFIHYHVMKLAEGKAVVLLDGQGGDEEFAGYHYFFGVLFKELFRRRKLRMLFREIAYYLTRHKSFFGINSFLYFLLPANIQTQIRVLENSYIPPDFLAKFKKEQTIPRFLYESTNLQESLLGHFEHKLEHLLKWEDRNSMRFSLESRVPFLDHRIVEKSLKLPSNYIINKGETKWFLREAMKLDLPKNIKERQDKIGFDNPSAEWFRERDFKDFIFDILNSANFRRLPYFDTERCLEIYRRHITGKVDASRQIWKWINLDLWYNKFLRG